MKIPSALPEVLLPWYEKNKRDLPWRADRDPYHIWLSEIMLQQTRVEAVRGYYLRFLEKLPSISHLAACDDDTLHKLWEGLGYYTRVRNLKKAAIIIMEQYHGRFPREYDKIRALPGIGDYTAGAIASIAFQLPTPAVDGNVLRVVSRICDDATPIEKPAFKRNVTQALAAVYPPDAAAFTQAMMELGATICGPNRLPLCHICPCQDFCLSKRAGTASQLPVKSPKKPRRTEEWTVFILRCDGRYAFQKRPGTGLLAGLWQFPAVPGILTTQEALSALSVWGLVPTGIHKQADRIHVFTHVQWDMRGYYVDVKEPCEEFCWFTESEFSRRIPLPTAFRQFWDGRV